MRKALIAALVGLLAVTTVSAQTGGGAGGGAGGGGGGGAAVMSELAPVAHLSGGNLLVPAVWDGVRKVWKFHPECAGYPVSYSGVYSMAAQAAGGTGNVDLRAVVTDGNGTTLTSLFAATGYTQNLPLGTWVGASEATPTKADLTLWAEYDQGVGVKVWLPTATLVINMVYEQ